MAKIEGACREVCEATEFVSIVTIGDDGPHVVGNWGDYMRSLVSVAKCKIAHKKRGFCTYFVADFC